MPIIPNDKDVLFGRGATIRSHPGNERLRSAVRARRPAFLEARREDKRDIARDIIDDIQQSGGRFLVEAPKLASFCFLASGQKPWVCADREKAVDKVMHRLREKEQGPEVDTPIETPRSQSCHQLGGATETIRNPQDTLSDGIAPAHPRASQDLHHLALAGSLHNMNRFICNATVNDGAGRAGSVPSENAVANPSVMNAQYVRPQALQGLSPVALTDALLQNMLRSIENPSTLDDVGRAGAVPPENLTGNGSGMNVQLSQMLQGIPPHALSGSLHNAMHIRNSTLDNIMRTANAVAPGNLMDNVSGMNVQQAGVNQALQGLPVDDLTRSLYSFMMHSITNPIPVNVGRAGGVFPVNLIGNAGTMNLQRASPKVLEGLPHSALARVLHDMIMMQSMGSSALGNVGRAGVVPPGNLMSNSSGMNVQRTLAMTLQGLPFNTLMGSLNSTMQFAGNNSALIGGRAGAVPLGSLAGNVMDVNQYVGHRLLQGLPPNALTAILRNKAGAETSDNLTSNASCSDVRRQLIVKTLLDLSKSTEGPNDQRSQPHDQSNFQTMINHQTGSATAGVGVGSTAAVAATHGARPRDPGGTKRAAANPLLIGATSSSSLKPFAKKRRGNLSGDGDDK